MLIDAGILTDEQLKQALLEQAKGGNSLRLGQFLTRKGLVGEQLLVEMLSRQLNIRKYQPDSTPIDPSLTQLIPLDFVQKHQIAPLRKKGRLLIVCTTDPLDIAALDAVEIMTNCEVEPEVCTEREMAQLISGLYGIQSGLGGMLETMDIDIKAEKEKEQEEQDVLLTSIQSMAGEAPVIRLVNTIFAQAVREGASDVHISPQQHNVQVRFRIDGKLHDVPAPPSPPSCRSSPESRSWPTWTSRSPGRRRTGASP
jgi:type IV pilus assembly protein PilB